MAVGDTVSAIYAVATTFQPAAGVQILFTQFLVTGAWFLDGNGDVATLGAAFLFPENNTAYGQNIRSYKYQPKIFTNNSSYYRFFFSSGLGGFTGIQTQ